MLEIKNKGVVNHRLDLCAGLRDDKEREEGEETNLGGAAL